jgi:hypothetical protein
MSRKREQKQLSFCLYSCSSQMNPTAVRLFVFSLLVLLGVSILFQPAPRPANCPEAQFSAMASSRIFFHNLRSYRYKKTAYPEKVMNHYLYRRSLKDPLQFMLIEQVASSEWHIRPFVRDSSIHAIGRTAEREKVDLLQADSEAYWHLAASIYASALGEESLLIMHEGDSLLFLLDQEERKRAEEVLFDYFRLVGCN